MTRPLVSAALLHSLRNGIISEFVSKSTFHHTLLQFGDNFQDFHASAHYGTSKNSLKFFNYFNLCETFSSKNLSVIQDKSQHGVHGHAVITKRGVKHRLMNSLFARLWLLNNI